ASLGSWFRGRKTRLVWNIRRTREAAEHMRSSTNLMVKVGRLMSPQADAIIYNSNRARDQHEREGYHNRHSCVIPNGFDTELWSPDPLANTHLRRELGLSHDAKLLGFVGRSHP